MTRWLVAWLLGCSVAAAALGCEATDRPQDPVWGKQPCEHCRMVLSEPRYAAQLLTSAGDRYHFDDVGCLVSYLNERHPRVAHVWVRSASGAWLDARHAHYSGGQRTPMGYGFAASPSGSLDFAALEHAVADKTDPRGAP